jgi:hypothetical protein
VSELTLTELENNDDFIGRHIGPREAEKTAMLGKLGYNDMANFIADVVPVSILESEPMALPGAQTEYATLARIREISDQNVVKKSSALHRNFEGIPIENRRNLIGNLSECRRKFDGMSSEFRQHFVG